MRGAETAQREKEALARITKFVENAENLIEKISAEDLIEKAGVNPYLAEALGMETIDEIVGFFLQRRVERTLSTSFGSVLEDSLRILLGGAKGKELGPKYGDWIKWWDIVIPDKKVAISAKSGPADMDKDQVKHFLVRAREAERKGFRVYLVFAYGKRASPLVAAYLEKGGLDPKKYLRIGKGVFREFLNDPAYHEKTLGIFFAAGKGAGNVFEAAEEKTRKITDEFNKRYAGNTKRMLADMF
ncbi:MAG: PmeII family type II restriction endonuclease [Candidatus Micrarchaeota archaeon]|nr:PmeII family type II restriction endonuclease [Candidatus Micrarchaeota archaeon]